MSTICRLCFSKLSYPIFQGIIFEKSVSYFDCNICAYVQT